ncbi:hypothetical protein BDZ97DRAFT_1922529 [Flammula alnicola]|nr:hypothetical protein BDZ97DRAFT_1922529 [Flammula alnicola]
MSPYPAASASLSSSSASPSKISDPTPKSDHRILIVVVILGIVGAFLIAYIIYITRRVNRRQSNGEISGPYQGTAMHQDHPAANITPFGAAGPHYGGQVPRFKHNPGEDMRIALRRPDGAWHFADSRTPFTPAGVTDIDVLPSPMSSSTSLFSFNSHLPSSKEQEVRASREHYYNPAPPPPAYYREPCREHFDGHASPL